MGRSGNEEGNFLGGSSSVEGLCARLREQDTANDCTLYCVAKASIRMEYRCRLGCSQYTKLSSHK